eukprot:285182-Rhodomonas_salina.1
MNLLNKALSGFKRGANGIKKLSTWENANTTLQGFNGALKTIGGKSTDAVNWYNRATANNVIPNSQVGIAGVGSTLSRLA